MCISTPPDLRKPEVTEVTASFDVRNFVDQRYIQKNLQSDENIVNMRTSAKAEPLEASPLEAHFFVQHNYHDHANEGRDRFSENRPCKGGVTTPFPMKLHEILDRVEEDGYASIVSWQPHGRCFVVHKPKEFKELLPNYFKFSKMASFQRQLNLYGFSRLTRGRDKGGYYHELFLRGKQFLANKIQRIKVKGTGVRARSNPSAEPNLWEMKWVFPSSAKTQCVSDTVSSSKPSVSTCHEINQPDQPMNGVLAAPQHSQSSLKPAASALDSKEDDDIVWSFGGKRFHYMDPFQMLEGEQRFLHTNNEEIESFISELQLDNLCDEIHRLVDEDDCAFVDLLERVVSN